MGRKASTPRKTQVAALCWKRTAEGLRVLVVTSRETRRWVIPKGWPMKGKTDAQAAAQEAYEEAGVFGAIDERPLGVYAYDKRLPRDRVQTVKVEVFPMEVMVERIVYPEQTEREKQWVAPHEAADLLDEAGLKAIVTAFAADMTPRAP